MQIRSPPRWLRIVSTTSAVLPVWRSPMISSRWPRPIGIMESIALMPVWTGSFTGCRSTTPGALNSSGRRSLVLIGGPPGGALDLAHDLAGLLVGELDRGGQLHLEPALLRGDEAVQLARDLAHARDPALLDEQEEEAPRQLVGVGEQLLEDARLRGAVDLRVLQQGGELGHLLDCRDE